MKNHLTILLNEIQENNRNKTLKKKSYSKIKNFFAEYPLSFDDIDYFLAGDDKLEGLLSLIGKKKGKKFKDSSFQLVSVLNDILFESTNMEVAAEAFAASDEDLLGKMDLGSHYNSNSPIDEFKSKIENICVVLLEKRPFLDKNAVFTSESLIFAATELLNKKEETKKKRESLEKQKADLELAKIVVEPTTWEQAKKQGTKLLSVEYITGNIKDESDKLKTEIRESFINPLTNNKISVEESVDYRTIHYGCEEFSSKTFVEQVYKKSTIEAIKQDLYAYERNPTEEANNDLIDSNIYQYFDCKQVLDNIFKQFKKSSTNQMESYFSQVEALKEKLSSGVAPLKDGFKAIVAMNKSKEILGKLEKLFSLKNKISKNLKFMQFEELIANLKKSEKILTQNEAKRMIYSQFDAFFKEKKEETRKILLSRIEQTKERVEAIRLFEYLIEFPVEAEIIDKILTDFRDFIDKQIEGYFRTGSAFDQRNLNLFFAAEFNQIASIRSSADEEKNRDLAKITDSLFIDLKEYVLKVNAIEEAIALKLSNIEGNRCISYERMTNEVFFKLVGLVEDTIFVEESLTALLEGIHARIEEHTGIKLEISHFSEKRMFFGENFESSDLSVIPSNLTKIYKLFENAVEEEGLETVISTKNSIFSKLFEAYVSDMLVQSLEMLGRTHLFDFNETYFTLEGKNSLLYIKEILLFVHKQAKIILNLVKVNKKSGIESDFASLKEAIALFGCCLVFTVFEVYQTEKMLHKKEYDYLSNILLEVNENVAHLENELKCLLNSLFGLEEVESLSEFIIEVQTKILEELLLLLVQEVSTVFTTDDKIFSSIETVSEGCSHRGVAVLKLLAIKTALLEENIDLAYSKQTIGQVLRALLGITISSENSKMNADYFLISKVIESYLEPETRVELTENLPFDLTEETNQDIDQLKASYSRYWSIFS